MKFDVTSRMTVLPEMSRRLRVFGFVSALLIVLIHSTPNPAVYTWQWWFSSLFGRDGLCRIAVPYFFLSAGFFLARHAGEKGWWRREVNKRVVSLVVPYFLWIGIGLIIHFVLWFGIQKTGKVCGYPNPFYGPTDLWVINTFGINPFSNKIGILWFVRDLFALVVISPLLLFMVKHLKWLFIGIIFAMYGVVAILQVNMDKGWYNFFEYFVSLRGLCYFTIGLLLRKYIDVSMFNKIPMYFCLGGGVILIAKIILLRYSYIVAATVVDIVMVPFLMVGLFYLMRGIKIPQLIISNTFAIYLMHQIFLLCSIIIITVLGLRKLMDSSIVIWFVRFAFAALMSIIFAYFIRRFLPRVANMLFGGR